MDGFGQIQNFVLFLIATHTIYILLHTARYDMDI